MAVIINKVFEREVIIRSTEDEDNHNEEALLRESKLSVLDKIQNETQVKMTFFYDYVVEHAQIENALQKVINRYPELSGRLNDERDRIVLSNQGSIIQYLHPSIISIDDLNDNKFDHQYCCENFFFPQGTEEGYLMTVTVQELSGASGMVIHFGIHHKLCDVIGAFLVVADFCSQVKNGCLKYEKIHQLNRTNYVKPSGKLPIFDHPILSFDSQSELHEKVVNNFLDAISKMTWKTIHLVLTQEKMKQLKVDCVSEESSQAKEVYTEKNSCFASTSDRLLSLIFQAFVDTDLMSSDTKSDVYETLVPVNARCRRNPEAPPTLFGNMVIHFATRLSKKNSKNVKPVELASDIRKEIQKINEEYYQSVVDTVSQKKIAKPRGCFDMQTMRFSSWDKLFDWYKDADLGRGIPLKFTQLFKSSDTCCKILPRNEKGDLDLLITLADEQIDRFLDHKNIKPYFTLNSDI